MLKIKVVPLGGVSLTLLTHLCRYISERMSAECRLGKYEDAPESSFDPVRQQYHSSAILERLSTLGEGEEVVLGICDFDLFVPILTYVFGEAQLGGSAALVSLTRLREGFYGLPEDSNLLFRRLEKEVLHEVGHVLGLTHCRLPDCVMHFSNSIEDVDLKSDVFCTGCASSLGLG